MIAGGNDNKFMTEEKFFQIKNTLFVWVQVVCEREEMEINYLRDLVELTYRRFIELSKWKLIYI